MPTGEPNASLIGAKTSGPAEILAAAGPCAAAALLLDPVEAGFAVMWWGLVLRVVRSDLATLLIPDGTVVAIAAFGLLHATMGPIVVSDPPASVLLSALSSLLAALVVSGTLWAGNCLGIALTGRRALGLGDIKLAGASAAWLSFEEQWLALSLATAAAAGLALLRRNDQLFPFGAVLAPAAWLTHLVGTRP
jgi:prepilin signal peptidase PulO-like enzyme (type II secretory pathway)